MTTLEKEKKNIETCCQFYCSNCRGPGLLYYNKIDHCFPVALCCNSLICANCYQHRTTNQVFNCKICAKQTGFGVRNKLACRTSIRWIECYEAYNRFYSSMRENYNYLVPLVMKANIFTDCEELGKVLSDESSPFQIKYHGLVGDFYTHVFLFYSLRYSPIMRLKFLSFKTSPRKLEFFKLMRDMTFFSNHSRKKILRWGLNGFNYFIIDKLSQGVKKKKFLVMLLRIVLAKNPKL